MQSRRGFLKGATAALSIVSVAPSFLLTGCESQQTIADLINTLGQATSQLATYINDPKLATQIQTDTAAAAAAVLAWKKGDVATTVVEALNLIEDDLNLIPLAGPYVPLIDLAIGTIEAIMQELGLTQQALTMSVKKTSQRRRVVLPYKAPKSSKSFAAKWNAIAPSQVQLTPSMVK